MPHPYTLASLRIAFNTVLGLTANWCPEAVLSGLGPKWRIVGGPKCPIASCWATSTSAWAKREVWGPQQTKQTWDSAWQDIVDRLGAQDVTHPGGKRLSLGKAEKIVMAFQDGRFHSPAHPVPRDLGRALQVAEWHRCYNRDTDRWLVAHKWAHK